MIAYIDGNDGIRKLKIFIVEKLDVVKQYQRESFWKWIYAVHDGRFLSALRNRILVFMQNLSILQIVKLKVFESVVKT